MQAKAARAKDEGEDTVYSLPPPSLRLLAEAARTASPKPASPLKRELGEGKGVVRG